jgi:hypothetical protein
MPAVEQLAVKDQAGVQGVHRPTQVIQVETVVEVVLATVLEAMAAAAAVQRVTLATAGAVATIAIKDQLHLQRQRQTAVEVAAAGVAQTQAAVLGKVRQAAGLEFMV